MMKPEFLASSLWLGLPVTLVGVGWLLPGTLFWGYVIIAALTFVTSLLGGIWMVRQRTPLDPLAFDSYMLRARTISTPLQRLRFYTTTVLSSLAAALAWPAQFVGMGWIIVKHDLFKSEAGSLAFLANVGLNIPYTTVSVVTTTIVIIVAVAEWILPAAIGYGYTFVLLLALAVIIQHVVYLVSTQSLSTTLRRSLGNPYASFVVIAIADLATLVLALSLYSISISGKQLGLGVVLNMANNILTLAMLRAAVSPGGAFDWFDGLVTAAGGLYIVNGFKSIFKSQDFIRTTDDLNAIAVQQLLNGDIREAGKWLDKVEKPDPRTYELRVGVYLAKNNLDKAVHAAETYVDEKKTERASRDKEVFRVLVSAVAATPLSKETLTEYFRHWISTTQHDLILQGGIDAAILRNRFTQEEALGLFTTDEAARQHALSFGSVLFRGGDYKNARQWFDVYESQDSAEKLVRILLIYRCLFLESVDDSSEENRRALQLWENENMAQLPEMAKQLRTDHERLAVIEHLYINCDFVEILGSTSPAGLNELAVELRNEIGGDETVLTVLGAIDDARGGRKQALRKLLNDHAQ